MTTAPRTNNVTVANAFTSEQGAEAKADLIEQADLWALNIRGGNLYTLTGYTATIADDELVLANYADIDAFEAAITPAYVGERVRVAGYPFAANVARLEAVALSDGSLEWVVV